MKDWIKTTTTPKQEGWYLCCISHRNIKSYAICKYYTDSDTWYIPEYLPKIYLVTHYQELPKLPKG